MVHQTGDDLPLLLPQLQLKNVELVGVGVLLDCFDPCNPQVQTFQEKILRRSFGLLLIFLSGGFPLCLAAGEAFPQGLDEIILKTLKKDFRLRNGRYTVGSAQGIPAYFGHTEPAGNSIRGFRNIGGNQYRQIADKESQVPEKPGSLFRSLLAGPPGLSVLEGLVSHGGEGENFPESIPQLRPLQMGGNLLFMHCHLFPELCVRFGLRKFSVIETVHKGEGPVYQVAQVADQLSIHLLLKILPGKEGIRLFGAIIVYIEAPYIRGDSCFLGVGTEHADPLALGELTALVVQILGG